MDTSKRSMPTVLCALSWVVAIITIVIANAIALSFIIGFTDFSSTDSMELESSSFMSDNDPILDLLVNITLITVPILQIASLILGIIVAVRNDNDSIRTTGSLMLLYKIGLVPFFLVGGTVEAFCIIGGFHPIFVGLTWVIGVILGVFGWFMLMAGSIWSIATAILMKRARVISAGELAVYIIMELFFFIDFIGAIIIFFRSRSALKQQPCQTTVATPQNI